jgi:putative Mn2+ efflux pump MntP
MGLHTSFLIALGLSMDAFAVAVADGSRAHRLRATRALKLATLFGLFQGNVARISLRRESSSKVFHQAAI